MKVSVVIPAYNQGKFLRETLESVLRSTKAPHEIIVTNDGSTDDTGAVCESFGNRIVYLQQANGGVSAARNAGLNRLSGDAVMLLDSDDLLERSWIEVASRELERARRRHPNKQIIHGDYMLFDNDGSYEKRVVSKLVGVRHFLRDSNVLPSGMLMTRKVIDAVGEFDGSLNACEDWDYNLRAALLGFEFHNVHHLAFRHREHADGASKRQTKALQARLKFLRKWVNSTELSDHQKEAVQQEVVRTTLRCRRDAFYAGRDTLEWTEAACRELGLGHEPFDPWLVTFGSVYLAPFFRKSIPRARVVEAAQSLGSEFRNTLSAHGQLNKGVERRIVAAVSLALAADSIAERDWVKVARGVVASVTSDPSLLIDGLRRGSRQVEEALRAWG